MSSRQVIFIVNLLQDINILRPLAYLAAHELNLNTCFLVTTAFRDRDGAGLWQQELNEIANETRSSIHDFNNEFQALQVLQNGYGVLVAASESHLDAHKPTHNLFRVAPSQYVKITLQHGFECVGFLQSRDQNLAHGSNITFASDIICGWCAPEQLTAVAPSQQHKLRVTGSTALLPCLIKKKSSAGIIQGAFARTGLVCENMHSPRLNAAGNFKSEFLDIFEKFCEKLALEGRRVTLRPHPGGQYVVKNDVPLMPNVTLENNPIYKIELKQFAYGISAPSSILIDMVLAGIPTAVWQDEGNVMDLGNYDGLTRISTLSDWLKFVRDAVERPAHYIEKQNIFLKKQKLVVCDKEIHKNFSVLLGAIKDPELDTYFPREQSIDRNEDVVTSERILFFAPDYIPTLQLSFLEPLREKIESKTVACKVLTEKEIKNEVKSYKGNEQKVLHWLKQSIDHFAPTVAVFCRWAGPYTPQLIRLLKSIEVACIFHLDDDLLNVPIEIGRAKWAYHNGQERLSSIRYLLENVDLVYCSTAPLKYKLSQEANPKAIKNGNIYCAGTISRHPQLTAVKKIGYMGIGHEADLQSIAPAIADYLDRYNNIKFELFGTIPIPIELSKYSERISIIPKINSYGEFLLTLANLDWDIGICPLVVNDFNLVKANTKWVEYTSAGIAVIASRGTVYDECCNDGCGVLAANAKEWLEALVELTEYPVKRQRIVMAAQRQVSKRYSPETLRSQVYEIINDAKKSRYLSSASQIE